MPTPGLLDSLNNILHLSNAEGRFMLSYYVRKYEAPAHLGGPGASGVEPPHALFRLGIAQYLMSKVGKVIDNKESDELGLNPEARRVLGEVWERHPSTQAWFDDGLLDGEQEDEDDDGSYDNGPCELRMDDGAVADGGHITPGFGLDIPSDDIGVNGSVEHVEDIDVNPASPSTSQRSSKSSRSARKPSPPIGGLNPLEKALLARACNISVETVEAYWDNMRWKTRAWGAMKAWCTAQDRKRIARAKTEGRW